MVPMDIAVVYRRRAVPQIIKDVNVVENAVLVAGFGQHDFGITKVHMVRCRSPVWLSTHKGCQLHPWSEIREPVSGLEGP